MTDTKLDVRVYPIDGPKGSTKAFASVGIGGMVAIRGIRVYEGDKGMNVSMPQSKDKEGGHHDIAFPLSGGLRRAITAAAIEEYGRVADLAPGQRGYGAPNMDTANSIIAQDVELDIRVFPIERPSGNTKAFASVGIGGLAAIRGIRVVDGKNGLFVTMPQSRGSNGEYHDIAFPTNGELRLMINKAVLAEYAATERTAARKPSLEEGLRGGAAKAAGQAATPGGAAPKPRAGARG